MRRRALLGGLAASWVGRSALAEGWWGRALPRQPSAFIFGYGSLINTASRNASLPGPGTVAAIPVRIAASFGLVRTWNARSMSGFTALGLRRPRPGEAASTINGVIYPVEGEDLAAFDAREVGYVRAEVGRGEMEAVSWQGLPGAGRVWLYVPTQSESDPGDGGAPSADFPLLQSYVDVVVEGALEYGEDYARELIETTFDWSPVWLNDRPLGRRPWVFNKQAGAIDRLLNGSGTAGPALAGRLFPEQFAIRYAKWRVGWSTRLSGGFDASIVAES